VLEIGGMCAHRAGDAEGAARAWREAFEVGRRIPNVMSPRIEGRLAALAQ